MKLRLACVVAAFLSLILSLSAQTAAQSPPPFIQFSNVATDDGGSTLSGVVNIAFSLYNAQQGGEPLWSETQDNIQLDPAGYYSVQLGITKPAGVPTALFTTGEARWLGVQIAGQNPQPRVLLVSVPYALKAGDAATVGGLPPSAFVLASPDAGSSVARNSQAGLAGSALLPATTVTTAGGKAKYFPIFSGASTIMDSVVYQSGTGSAAKVGVGTITPAATLDVAGAVNAATSFNLGGTPFAFGAVSPTGNAFLGFAGNSTMTGNGNTAVGVYALSSDTKRAGNTAIGFAALDLNMTGNGNTVSGENALFMSTTGSYNTADGESALGSSTTGSYNTASGVDALSTNTAGSYGVAMGYYAGQTADQSAGTGNNNTAIGAGSAFGTGTLTNATAIGSNAEVTASNALVLGSVNGVNSATSSVNVGIGTTAPGSTLEVALTNNAGLGPTLTLTNAAIGSSVATSLDFNTFPPAYGTGYNPTARMLATDDGHYSSNLIFSSNTPDAQNHGLRTNMTIYSNGNVAIAGTLSKGAGSFKIDHPLDPANKYLYHSFVESPDMMNVYNGNVVTDRHGVATVTLPDYFEALNQDFRYQLTVMGQFAQAIVARKIAHNCFVIRTSKPNVEVSWQVTGIRHDAFADAHRIQVEVEKSPQEQGRYLHPELYGAPAEQAIGYQAPPVPTKPSAQDETARVSSLKASPTSLK
jgi:hypothetical protein